MTNARRWEAEAALLGNSFIWGTTFVLVKAALADVSPLLFLLLRFGLAAAILAAIYGRRFERASLGPGLLAGVFLFLGYFLQTAGLQFTTPGVQCKRTGSAQRNVSPHSAAAVTICITAMVWKLDRAE